METMLDNRRAVHEKTCARTGLREQHVDPEREPLQSSSTAERKVMVTASRTRRHPLGSTPTISITATIPDKDHHNEAYGTKPWALDQHCKNKENAVVADNKWVARLDSINFVDDRLHELPGKRWRTLVTSAINGSTTHVSRLLRALASFHAGPSSSAAPDVTAGV